MKIKILSVWKNFSLHIIKKIKTSFWAQQFDLFFFRFQLFDAKWFFSLTKHYNKNHKKVSLIISY